MTSASKPKRDPTEASECKSCGALILWTKTRSEKSMPVDAGPVKDGDFVVTLKKPANELHVEKFYAPKHQGRNRFTSHFATCWNASQHRKPKEEEVPF